MSFVIAFRGPALSRPSGPQIERGQDGHAQLLEA
jgi:hypothetical protein